MASTNDLDRLKKSAQGIQATNDSNSESFSRDRVISSEEIKTGLSRLNGSWASEYDFGENLKLKTGLGTVGLGDVDFIPYIENSNRIGAKGSPSLGSPIAFEVVGPTLKSADLIDWVWSTNLSANYIELEHSTKTIESEYGIPITALADYTSDFGGLYVAISYVGTSNESWVSGFSPATATSNIENTPIYRVRSIGSNILFLDSDTPLDNDFSGDGHIAGITLLRKKASRMYEVPSSGGTTFFVMPPETTCSLDTEPPLSNWVAGDFTTYSSLLGGSGITAQNTLHYGNRVKTAVPAPYSFGGANPVFSATVLFNSSTSTNLENGTMFLILPNNTSEDLERLVFLDEKIGVSNLTGLCVRISKVSYDDNMGSNNPTDAQKSSLLGFYEIVGANGGAFGGGISLALRSVTNQHHVTGQTTWFNVGGDNYLSLEFTIHRSVSQLLQSSNPLTHEIESARIKSLISPNLNSNSESARLSSSLMRGGSCTWVDGEPSRLSDLGFGVVVYPAKLSRDGNSLVADFNNPLSSDLYDVDYEGATVYLKNSYSQSSSVTNHSTNPSKRTVLFISCVALSQSASFGTRFISNGKGAFSLPELSQVLTTDKTSLSDLDPATFWSAGTNSVFVPNLAIDEIPKVGIVQTIITMGANTYDLKFTYRGVSSSENGVNLNNVLSVFDPYNFSNATPDVRWHILRNPYLTKEQTDLVGSTVRADTISLSDGSISYNVDGSISLSVGGLRTDESTLLYNSTTNNWEIDSDSYEVGLEIKRGDLIASNVTELPTDNLEVRPLVLTSIPNMTSANEDKELTFSGLGESYGINLPELTGFYLNVEGASIRSKVVDFTNGSRVVLGLDFANTKANPWQSKYVSFTNTGSTLEAVGLKDALDQAIISAYPSEYSDKHFLNDSNGCLVLAGRSPSVFPAYSYINTVSIGSILEQFVADGADPTQPTTVNAFKYLLSLEEVHGNKWVTVAVNVPSFTFSHSLVDISGNINNAIDNAKELCERLNLDIYFGHSARLLNRAGFYEGFHQDLDTGTGDVTVSPLLQTNINTFTKHTVRGERQVLWITVDDPRHSNYGSVSAQSHVTLELICTGRGCGKIPFINGAISGDNLKLEAIKAENQLINVIASIGRAEELETSSTFEKLFNGLSGVATDYHRIGLYWESTTLPTGTEARDASASGNHLELGFDRNGFLPLGPALGSSRLISYAQQSSTLTVHLADNLPKSSGREAGSPIRNRFDAVGRRNLENDGSRYFDIVPFLVNSNITNHHVGESFDFLIQDHWLDNPSFSFNSEDDLSQEDLGLFTWVSRDFEYTNTSDLTTASLLGYICTFSANKREFASFKRPLSYALGHKGYDDILVSIKSEYFTSDLFSSSVLQKGDEIYFNSMVSSLNRRAKAHITHRSDDDTGAYNLLAILKSVNSQYGGFSESAYYQPRFTFFDDAIISLFDEFSGSNLQTASLISGNNFYWTSGNLRSLISMASIPNQLTFNETNDNRDTSAIDGGFGSFGSLSASLLTGGRLGLFNGLPQKNAGISFASISGGSGLTDTSGGQDIGYDDRYRVFETFLDHGIFPFVSLPSGSGGSYSSTLGSLSRERDKRSDYKSGVFGGNAGLRVSGDIQLFVRNLRILGSDDNTAFVMHTDFAPPTDTDYMIYNQMTEVDISSPFLPYNSTGTGPITSGHQAQKAASGFNYLGLKSQGGGHMPSGVGLFGPVSNTNISDVSVRRTATISLGLTLADLKGISKSLGREVTEPVGDDRQVTPNFPGQYGTEIRDIGNALFHMAQFSTSEIPTLALPSLRGTYVALNKYKHTTSSNLDLVHADNFGIYRVIDTPVLMPVDASDLESGQGSRNTLHGYGSDYTAHTRASLNTIVANIMVRVESDEVRSIYPDPTKSDQAGKSLTPTELVIDSLYLQNTELGRKTNRLGHSWRLLNKTSYGMFTDIFIFDVMDQGGSPTSSPSDLFGLELNPRALGKQSFPAEISPISFTENDNSDVPDNLDFAPEDVYLPIEQGLAGSIGMRLLGVHRTMSHKGKTSSLAFVTQSPTDIADIGYEPSSGDDYDGSPYIMGGSLKDRFGNFVGDSPARMVVYSSERSDRLDEVATTTTKRLLENGETGYVSLGYPERFGLGVILDGGLGVVSGNAVRVHPQKGNFDSLGSLTLYSSPMMDSRNDLRDGNAVTLPSRFNRTEFYGDVVVAGHDSDLVIDDARTVDGAYARVNEAQASASTTKNYQSRLLRFGEKYSTDGAFAINKNLNADTYLTEGFFDEIPNLPTGVPFNYPSYFNFAPPPPLPNDTILPWTNAGVRVKASGGVVYERAFRPQDATGADIVASMAKGAKSDRGLRGLEIPAYGECLLLPKGPSTLGGRVYTDKNSGAKIRTGITPTDLPLYEFYNGPNAFAYGGDFAVTLGNIYQEHGLYGKDGVSEGATMPSPMSNFSMEQRFEEFNAGILSQAYHHARSAEEGWGKLRRKIYLYTQYNSSSDNANEGFAVFFFYKGKRYYPYLYLNTTTVNYIGTPGFAYTRTETSMTSLTPRTLNGHDITFTPYYYQRAVNYNNNPYNDDRIYEATNVDTIFDGFHYDAYFYIPNEVSNIYVETEVNSSDTGNPDIALFFYDQPSHRFNNKVHNANYSGGYVKDFTLDLGQSGEDAQVYFDLYPDAGEEATAEIHPTGRAWVHKVTLSNEGEYTYTYSKNITISDLSADPHSSTESVNGNATNWFLPIDSPYIKYTTTNFGTDVQRTYPESSSQTKNRLQVRLLDGMVLEDTTSGAFYTVGEIGRYRGWTDNMKPLGQPGEFIKFPHSYDATTYANLNAEAQSSATSLYTNAGVRNMNHGSMIGSNGYSTPEVFYDLSPHYKYNESQGSGFGDVVDDNLVRRPSLGHKFRVVPNVEFVPVLGHRSVKGGLAVPYDKTTNYQTYIQEADAILYDANYHFLESDIGRKIYVCGTYEYAYVGWYVIIGIQKNYLVNEYEVSPSIIQEDHFDVAVVRKIKRSGEYVRTWDQRNDLPLPMRPKPPVLEASMDRNSNGRNMFKTSENGWVNYDFHMFDPFTPQGTEHSRVLSEYVTVSDLGDSASQTTSNATTGIFLGLKAHRGDKTVFYGIGADKDQLASEADKGTYFLVQALNNDPNFNGIRFGNAFKASNVNKVENFPGWSTYDGASKWVKWELKYAYQDTDSVAPVPYDKYNELPVRKGYIICGITCSIDPSVLTEEQARAVLSRGCFLQVDLMFNDQRTNPYGGYHDRPWYLDNYSDVIRQAYRGFYYFKGHSSNTCISWGDKNNYYPNHYIGTCANIGTATGLDINFDLHGGATDPLSETQIGDGNSALHRTSQSASGGIRWVFSAPLLEENVGSYVHLTKPRPYRFGQPTATQNSIQNDSNVQTLTNPFGWASGWQRQDDLDAGEKLDIGTDIFRVNRCPATGDILLGGDCESYSVEDILCRTTGGFTRKGLEISYAPLSVMGNWPDSFTNELPTTGALNYPILYALQPIARERIVSVKPTSATSSVLMAHGQYGNAPMVLPASPLALDTPNSLKGSVNWENSGAMSQVGKIHFDSSTAIELSAELKGSGLVFTGTTGFEQFINSLELNSVVIDSDYGGKDFVWGERLMMDVSRPWLLMGRESVSQTHRFRDINTYAPSDTSNFDSNRYNPETGNERYNINADYIRVDDQNVPINVSGNLNDTTSPVGGPSTENSFGGKRNRKPDASTWTSIDAVGVAEGSWLHQIDDDPSIEGGNSETRGKGTTSYSRAKTPPPEGTQHYDLTNQNWTPMGLRQAIYTWTPSGEWWQIQTPLYHGFRSAFLNESVPPPTLKIDLTDTFTQAVSQGSGLNSPYIGRTPRGSRLNRIWVNFGIDGDLSQFPGSPFHEDGKEHFQDPLDWTVPLSNTDTRNDRFGQEEDEEANYNELRRSNSSITFNLIVELPGSVAFSEDHFYMDDTSNASYDTLNNTDVEGELFEKLTSNRFHSFEPLGGSNGNMMGGRLPSGAYNHSSNSNFSRTHDSTVSIELDAKKRFAGGTIVVPLYVNREAGDMMPNVMERFVNVGPARFRNDEIGNRVIAPVKDWNIGDGTYGLGTVGNENTSISDPDGDVRHSYQNLDINSITPVVWGGQNFYQAGSVGVKVTGLRDDLNDGAYNRGFEQPGEISTFEDIRSGGVLASVMPRSSRVGGGVTSCFTSGIYSDLGLFSPEYTKMEMAIHAPATTGITIAHGGGLGDTTSFTRSYDRFDPSEVHDQVGLPLYNTFTTNGFNYSESDIEGGAFGYPKSDPFERTTSNALYARRKRQQSKTSSQCFTLALTPVGDEFKAPSTGAITMPKISSNVNIVATNLYENQAFWNLGRYGRTLETNTGTDPKDRRFKVGNWLDNILDYYGIPAQSGSMLPPGSRVFLEVTVPWARRPQKDSQGRLKTQISNNGAWVSSVKCAFEVETADGTAWTLDVNTMGED